MFFSTLKIRTKITSILLLLVILSIFAISYLSFIQSKISIEQKYAESFEVISNLKTGQINKRFEDLEHHLKFIYKSEKVVLTARKLNMISSFTSSLYKNLKHKLDVELIPKAIVNRFSNILMVDRKGQLLYHSYKPPAGMTLGEVNKQIKHFLPLAQEETYYSKPFSTNKGVCIFIVSPPIKNRGLYLGHVILLYNLEKNIYPILEDRIGLGETGELLLCRLQSEKITEYISPLKHRPDAILSEMVLMGSPLSMSVQKAALGEGKDFGYDQDYRDEKVLSYWNYIPTVKWGLVTKIDYAEVKQGLDKLLFTFLQSAFVILLISTSVSLLFSKYLTTPLLTLKQKLKLVAEGILQVDFTNDQFSQDEIGEMADALNDQVIAMRKTANFAEKIGQGQYHASFDPLSENDTLGNALLSMRNSIQKSDKKDKERSWIVSGVAEAGQVLRMHNSLDKIGDAIIGYVAEKIEAMQGGLYTTQEMNNGEAILELNATYAFSKKKYLQAQFKFREGLIGQVAADKKTMLRTEIPKGYTYINSGIMGDQEPKCLLIVPLISEDKVFGVIELLGLDLFSDTQIVFVEEVSVVLARTIHNLKNGEKTLTLLQESRKMSEELQQQQATLQQNAEIMETTQEQLQETNEQLEKQIQASNNVRKRMQLLLENASEIISIYETNGAIRYISPSVQPILGLSPEELIGSNDLKNIHPDSLPIFTSFFERLLESPSQKLSIQYAYTLKNGEIVWLEATGTNLLNAPSVQGILINSRDITERKKAEKETRKRSQMQSLSENSKDLILRINAEGEIYYVNPAVKQFAGLMPENYLGKNYQESDFEPKFKENIRSLVEEVINAERAYQEEIGVDTTNGVKIMQIFGIPEFNEIKEIESVLITAHDITERKKAEDKLFENNKKIRESINYAQRIQSAILPTIDNIKEELKESFVFYKPRDVVSGDFPWYMKQEETLYLAVADCTGHGVPGALISIIGFFLLNQIVKLNPNASPSDILYVLNEEMTKALKQNKASSTRDGMDIAMIKMDKSNNYIEFAGAHRPLYHFDHEKRELNQIKGERLSIGGGFYKTGTQFTNHKISYKEGDEVYIFSDGLADQFGGENDRKFGPRRIRNIITAQEFEKMQEAHETFEKNFDDWKGKVKQTDDILLIGFRF